MKKFFVLLVLVISITSFSFGSYVGFGQSNTQISKTSKQIERINRLVNPNLIYPDQELLLPIPGLSYPIYYNVVTGDCLWYLSKRINRGEFTPTEEVIAPIIEKQNPQGESFWLKYGDFIASNFLWLLLLIFVLAVIYKIARWELSKPRNVDPATAGAPQVPGGVPDAGAHNRILEIARNHYPSATLNLKNVRRGFLSGTANVHYANEKTKKINLKNVPSYAGEILVNGEVKTIYFLQPCGNDANRGDYMEGKDLVFTPSVFISENGNESPLSTNDKVIDEKVPQIVPKEETKQEEPEPVETSTESEIYKTISAHTMLADEFLKTQTAHRVTLRVTTPQGTVETVLETKTGETKTKNEEKKG
ncbi:MAG: LysM peptidoglycan-binding domain-containing protein [Candidatus Nomurabacteria bacterium]